MRLPLLGSSFWLDEAAQALESARPLSQQLNIAADFQPPLLHLLIWFFMLFNQSEIWLRTFGALIPGMISLVFTYLLARQFLGKRGGAISGLLLGLSSFHIFYSQELRPYSLATMWAVMAWWALVQKPSQAKNWVFGLASLGGLFTIYLYPFNLLAQLLWLLWTDRKLLKNLSKTLVVVGIIFALWLPGFWNQFQASQSLRSAIPIWSQTVSTPWLKALPLTYGKFIFGVVDLKLNAFYILSGLIVMLMILLGTYGFWQNRKKLPEHTYRFWQLLLFWILAGLILSWLTSLIVPVLQPKRVLFILPAIWMYLTLIWNTWIKQLNPKTKKIYQTVGLCGLGLCLILNLSANWQYWTQAQLQRENWRDLVAYLEKNYSQQNTVMVFAFGGPFAPVEWYQTKVFDSLATGQKTLDPAADQASIAQFFTQKLEESPADAPVILVFDYLRDLTDPNHVLDAALAQTGYKLNLLIPAGPIGFVREYKP